MPQIRHLSETTINRIAAGEVVDRPASVVKELVENALDAGATTIEIILDQAGKNLISVIDNGCGMSKEDLAIAIKRHTTSKLNEDDIMAIHSFGFRGEALPSIGSISRMSITSRTNSAPDAFQITVEGGKIMPIILAAHNVGTKIIVRDLFFATPARLKFLKTDKTELASCIDIVKKIAMSHCHCAFTLSHNDKTLLKLRPNDNLEDRITAILGEDFIRNSVHLDTRSDNIHIQGLISLPTFNKASSEDQFLFINNRSVKDKLLATALKVAYQDYLPPNRFPVAVLNITTEPNFVDVNVHPAKTEVRFRDPNRLRGILISAIKSALYTTASQVSDMPAAGLLNKMAVSAVTPLPTFYQPAAVNYNQVRDNKQQPFTFIPDSAPLKPNIFTPEPMMRPFHELTEKVELPQTDAMLGAAVAQLHENYIIAQTNDSIIIIDQHAAHERLTYEKLKLQIAKTGIIKQRLLIPEIIDILDEKRLNCLEQQQKQLADSGIIIEFFGNNSLMVTEIPAIIGDVNIRTLIEDIADNLLEMNESHSLTQLMEHILETYACHHSIRSGRKLSLSEMNMLLREMENTPFSGQCNHGRPTYIELKLKDIEKLFGRT